MGNLDKIQDRIPGTLDRQDLREGPASVLEAEGMEGFPKLHIVYKLRVVEKYGPEHHALAVFAE